MSRPYDASLKDLIEQHPADWLPLAGLRSTAPIEVIDADLSTVTAAADKVLRVMEKTPWLLHFELQSSPKTDLAEQLYCERLKLTGSVECYTNPKRKRGKDLSSSLALRVSVNSTRVKYTLV